MPTKERTARLKQKAAEAASELLGRTAVMEPPSDPASRIQPSPIARLLESSVIFVLSFSRLQPKRTIGRENIGEQSDRGGERSLVEIAADTSMFTAGKSIIDSPELRKIASYDCETVRWFRVRCTSAPKKILHPGAHIMSVDLLADAFAWMDVREAGRTALFAELKAVYPVRVAEAKVRLKELFDADEYPAVEDLEREFSMDYNVMEWGTPKKISTISQAAYEKEMAKAKATWTTVAANVEAGLIVGLQKKIAHLVERLTGEVDGKPKRLNNTALARVEEFLELLPKINLTGNVDIVELGEAARRVIKGVDVKKLKEDKDVRASVVETMSKVTAALDKMMVDAPKRAMNFRDEEV